jgi:hypothetical protein
LLFILHVDLQLNQVKVILEYLAVQPWLFILHVDLQLNQVKVITEKRILGSPAQAP